MSENNYDKPSKAPLIIAISVVVVLLLAAGGVLFWMNRPINQVNTAIENNDLKAVNENFEKLSDDDKEDIEEQMLDYAKDLAKDFTNGKKDYDDIEKDLRTLGKGVLKDNDDFEELTKQVEQLKQSKDDYEAAEKAFKEEDYQKAMDLYAKVIADDTNYKDARDKIAECESKMTPDIVGEWACSVDIGNAMLKQIGLNSSEKDFTFPVVFLYIFNEDGTGRMTLDKSGFEDKIKEFFASKGIKFIVWLSSFSGAFPAKATMCNTTLRRSFLRSHIRTANACGNRSRLLPCSPFFPAGHRDNSCKPKTS